MTALPLSLKETCAHNRALRHPPLVRRVAAAFVQLEALMLLALALFFAGPASAAAPVKGEIKVSTDGGYARLVFRFDQEVEAKIRLAGTVMVISFKQPVDVAVDRINANAPDYIGAARRDPDGSAIRIALARKVKVNLITAAEQIYVDILPDDWSGMMPGLPQEVVDELARRARDAERQLHQQRLTDKQKKPVLIRVKVASLPTIRRYVFEMPETANVVPERGEGKLTLNFDQQIKWDLADAKAALPPTLESIESESDTSSATVIFTLNGVPEVRTFREDRSIVVDVGLDGAKPKQGTAEGAEKVAAAPQSRAGDCAAGNRTGKASGRIGSGAETRVRAASDRSGRAASGQARCARRTKCSCAGACEGRREFTGIACAASATGGRACGAACGCASAGQDH